MVDDPATAFQPGDGTRRLPLTIAVVAVVLLAALAFSRVRPRADMSSFVPAGNSAAARLMHGEISTGDAAGLVLTGIEGNEPAELARISDALASGLRESGQFAFVANGRDVIGDADMEFLFRRRYLLSPAVTLDSFDTVSLRRGFQRVFSGLQGSAAPLVARYGFADPTGAFLALAASARGGTEVRTLHGVWFAPRGSPGPERALLIARMKIGGMNVEAQDAALAAVQAAFAASRPGDARLVLSGPAVFSHDAAHAIRADVTLLSVVSALLVAALLMWRFRSPWVIAAILVPIALSVSAAALAVQLAFGFVHGITLGFGMTMLGITVDYPVLLIGHRKRGEPAPDTLRRIGKAFNLAVMTAALGLTGMMFSGFPGLSQLGLFSVVGLLTAAAVTRWILPGLIVAADLAPVAAGNVELLRRVERLRAWRFAALPLIGAAALVTLLGGAPPPERDIAALSTIPEAARALDARLRADLGIPDTGPLIVVEGPSAESVLRREEALTPRIDALVREGVLSDADSAARLWPSTATQLARRAMLPAPDVLAARVTEAMAGLPFQADAFAPFIESEAAAREMLPVRLEDIDSPALRERLRPLLFERDGVWYGLIVPHGVTDPARLTAALPESALNKPAESALNKPAEPALNKPAEPAPNAMPSGDAHMTWLDMRAEADLLLVRATAQAWRWLIAGGLAAFAALAVSSRDWRHIARVTGAVGAALLVTFAVLGLAGARLSLLHVVALQLVMGVGLDYALFFARRQLDEEERSRTLRTLVTCNAMSLLTFGLLAFCRTPLLREIGVTTAVGVVCAMIFAFLFAGEARPALEEKS